MSEDPILCYCFGTTRAAVREHFARPEARLQELIDRTGLTTKCTACALDLDVLLDEIHGTKDHTRNRPRAAAARRFEIAETIARVDSGFLMADARISTYVRLANYPPFFEGDGLCAPHDYALSIFDNQGKVCTRLRGRIGRNQEVTIDLAAQPACPEQGWFLLRLMPEGSGHYGTLRPQVVLDGGAWVACYHTQFHSDASRDGRRAGTPLRAIDGRTRTLVSIINGGMVACHYVAVLHGAGSERKSEGTLAGNGACVIDVDAAFSDLPSDATLILRIHSDQPTRKNLINRHPDGSLGVEHFPNLV